MRSLKFTVAPKSNSTQLTCDLKTFADKLRLTECFDDHNVMPIDQKDESLVRGKSNFLQGIEIRNLKHILLSQITNITNGKYNKKNNL